jgi:hypothetical protein
MVKVWSIEKKEGREYLYLHCPKTRAHEGYAENPLNIAHKQPASFQQPGYNSTECQVELLPGSFQGGGGSVRLRITFTSTKGTLGNWGACGSKRDKRYDSTGFLTDK